MWRPVFRHILVHYFMVLYTQNAYRDAQDCIHLHIAYIWDLPKYKNVGLLLALRSQSFDMGFFRDIYRIEACSTHLKPLYFCYDMYVPNQINRWLVDLGWFFFLFFTFMKLIKRYHNVCFVDLGFSLLWPGQINGQLLYGRARLLFTLTRTDKRSVVVW